MCTHAPGYITATVILQFHFVGYLCGCFIIFVNEGNKRLRGCNMRLDEELSEERLISYPVPYMFVTEGQCGTNDLWCVLFYD